MIGLVALAAVAACSFEGGYTPGMYTCPDGETCPEGFSCVAMMCIAGDAGAGAGADADAPPADAGAPADAGPDAAPVDFCEEALGAQASDTCADADAFDITADARMPGGVILYGDTRPHDNHLGAVTPAPCMASTTPGNDAIYTLNPSVGEVLRARLLTQDFDSALYVIDACSTAAAIDCSGDDELFTFPGPQPPEEIATTINEAETLYLVVDSPRLPAAVNSQGCYALEVSLE